MKNRSLYIVATAVLATAAFAIPPEESIKWTPKKGEKASYKMVLEVDGATVTVISTSEVIDIKSDGNVVSRESVDSIRLTMGSFDSDLGPQGSAIMTFARNGELVNRESDTPVTQENARFAETMMIIYPDDPVKVGDTWKRTIKADTTAGKVPCETVFKFVGVEAIDGKDCWKITYDFKETNGPSPIMAKVTVWLDKKDGSIVLGEYDLKNVEFQPGTIVDATGKLTRIN
jgi:hypothetical protein